MMQARPISLIVLLYSCLSGCSLLAPNVSTELIELRGGQYQLDPQHASLLFKIKHLGLSNYVGRFNSFDAQLNFDPTAMEKTTLEALVSIGSIDTNNPSLEETLLGASWFDSATYPQAFFNSTEVTPAGDGFHFKGQLTLAGITRPVTLYGHFLGGAVNRLNGRYTLGFQATGHINRSDFGIDNYLSMIGDRVELEIEVEFLKQ